MENAETVLLNGVSVDVAVAHEVMFAQCTLRGKQYLLDTSTSPITLTIFGYDHPADASAMKHAEVIPVASRSKTATSPKVGTAGCGSCGDKKQ